MILWISYLQIFLFVEEVHVKKNVKDLKLESIFVLLQIKFFPKVMLLMTRMLQIAFEMVGINRVYDSNSYTQGREAAPTSSATIQCPALYLFAPLAYAASPFGGDAQIFQVSCLMSLLRKPVRQEKRKAFFNTSEEQGVLARLTIS